MIRRSFEAIARYLKTSPATAEDELARSIQEEIETHLAHSVDAHVAEGLSPVEARRAAHREFGQITPAVRGCQDVWQWDQRVLHRVHLAVTCVLLFGALAWWFSRSNTTVVQPNAVVAADEAPAGDLRGRVVDDASRPIERAHILAVVKTWPNNGYRQQAHTAITDSHGNFSIEDIYPLDARYAVQLAVIADGRSLESVYVEDGRGQLEPFAFQLAATNAFQVRFRGPDGLPLPNVEVFPHRRVDDAGHYHYVYFQGSEPIVQRTDETGSVPMTYFRSGERATMYFRAPGGEWQTRDLRVPTKNAVTEIELDDKLLSEPEIEDQGT